MNYQQVNAATSATGRSDSIRKSADGLNIISTNILRDMLEDQLRMQSTVPAIPTQTESTEQLARMHLKLAHQRRQIQLQQNILRREEEKFVQLQQQQNIELLPTLTGLYFFDGQFLPH